ncbi:hypothetical protein R4P47_24780 [Rhodococcus sp. IEGM 1370]|uniref:hypothetical protein n=1 Tax=Rhodococcus sp. IEGM 1370 TaxID=3082222 RepID=UPI0029537A80|nr:hypothetical protein [Rhodococcus sp. IEGM 1370]MDV8079786.1 hypothetical protein [Rhodococcus sp. IEGM 1370]
MGNIDTTDLFLTIKTASELHDMKAQTVQAKLNDGVITQKGAEEQFAHLEATYGWNDTLAEVRNTVETELTDAQENIAKQRAKLTAPTGSTADQQLAETRVARVWPRVQSELESANGAARLDIALKAVQSADDSIKPILVQELVPYLLAKGIHQDGVDQLFLRPLFPRFAKALDDLRDDTKAAVQVRHNLNIAESRTKAGMKYNRGLAQHWVEPVNA